MKTALAFVAAIAQEVFGIRTTQINSKPLTLCDLTTAWQSKQTCGDNLRVRKGPEVLVSDDIRVGCEDWLGGRDSNPDNMLQRHASYRWTTSQHRAGAPGRANFQV